MDNINLIHDKPRFFWLMKWFFPAADWDGGVVITYGKNVYCKYNISESLAAHEATHVRQQTSPLFWWIRYVMFPSFRFKQELEAHRNEYRAIKGYDGNKKGYLDGIAYRLSGPLYNNMVTLEKARELILKS